MRAGQDRDEGQGDVNPVLLELDKKLSDQNVRVNKLQLKGQQLANQLQLNFSEIEKQRANIRDSLRSRYYNDTTVVANGRVAIGSSRTFGDEPNRVSIYFAMVEQAEMKNKQSRIRAMYGSYKNLIKTYLIEARELDRLEILKDMAVKGMDIKPSQLNRPTAASSTGYRTFDEDEDDNESEKKAEFHGNRVIDRSGSKLSQDRRAPATLSPRNPKSFSY